MEITKREVIVSVAIISIMLVIGFFISADISSAQADKISEYQKAIHIEDPELFQYGIETGAGNAFVYGELVAVDSVTFSEIGGEYMYVEKVKERYTRHTRLVTYTTGSGKDKRTHTRTEVYWTWDTVGNEKKQSNEVRFCGVVFPNAKINIPAPDFVDTIKESSNIRYKYYGTPAQNTGTLYTKLSNKTISDSSMFYRDCTIDRVFDNLTSGFSNIIFWFFWISLIILAVAGFYYLDNRWLD